MNLYDKVKFTKYLKKNSRHIFTTEHITDKEYKELCDKGSIEYRPYIEEQIEETTGLIVGKRSIGESVQIGFAEYEGKGEFDNLEAIQGMIYQEIYLIPKNLNGFYRVPDVWLEKIEEGVN